MIPKFIPIFIFPYFNFNTKSKELAVDLDGADVYHPNDQGLDYNSNGGIEYNSKTHDISGDMYGIAVDKGKPIIVFRCLEKF